MILRAIVVADRVAATTAPAAVVNVMTARVGTKSARMEPISLPVGARRTAEEVGEAGARKFPRTFRPK